MVKKSNPGRGVADSTLLNFHFSNGPSQPSQDMQPGYGPRSGSFNGNNRQRGDLGGNNGRGHARGRGRGRGGEGNSGKTSRSKQNDYRNQRSAEDRASARRKAASNMFPLHSSPDHAFVLTRQAPKCSGSHYRYTFSGPDQAVSWESVRIVKYLVAVDQLENATTCPICLDCFTVVRITKCGHCFCLPCLIHHVHSFADKTLAPKCPCCGIPLFLKDLRPVQITGVTQSTPVVKSKMHFVKLHRVKDCPTPYLPFSPHPRRSSPHAAPCVTDSDAAYCRFNYLDVPSYQRLLEGCLQQLLEQHSSSTLEAMCLGTAVQMVQEDLQLCITSASIELELQEQYSNHATGMYQDQLPLGHVASGISGKSLKGSEPFSAQSLSWDDEVSPTIPNQHLGQILGDRVVATSQDPDEELLSFGANRRNRGDSISSYGAVSTGSDGTPGEAHCKIGGSAYAHDDEYSFYQANDGSLCFLSAFNMNCLQHEYAATVNDASHHHQISTADDGTSPTTPRRCHNARLALPDALEGKVLEVERVHMTADARQRRRFLSHIPLYSDICFVEISLSHVLSSQTKKAFKNEFLKRNQARASREAAERRSDDRLKRKEEERINELKARFQRIDPSDDFFQPSLSAEPDLNMFGEDFGPPLDSSSTAVGGLVTDSSETTYRDSAISFSQICGSGYVFPSLSSAPTEANFPALGSSPPTPKRAPPPKPWGSSVKTADSVPIIGSPEPCDSVAPIRGSKKGKGKKIVLFSTGGFRGDYN